MDGIDSILIGISTSLIATVIFIMATKLIAKVILPWYADKIYRGVRVDGEWIVSEVNGVALPKGDRPMKFLLFQSGDVITGTYTHPNLKTGSSCEYNFHGKIRDMHLMGVADPISKKMVDAISVLFYIKYENSTLSLSGGVLSSGKSSAVFSHTVVFEQVS